MSTLSTVQDNMSTQFFSKLSQNYIGLLKDDKYCDITIEVGKDPNVKLFRAHMNILCNRSPYLRRVLASNKKNNDSILAHIKLPNVSPEIFQIILKYIYGGILTLNGQKTSGILNVLVAADVLRLQEPIDYLQKYLIKNKFEWMKEHIKIVQRISSQSNTLLELQQFCTDFIANSPEKVFKSPYFTSLPEKSLVQIIKRDDLQMKEVEIWEHILKWGLAQNPTLIPDPDTWSDDDFKTVENTLQHCLSSIRFFSLSSKEFLQKVCPYKKLLNRQLYKDLEASYLDPNNEPNKNISPPRRSIKTDGIIDSKIVNLNIVSTISRWVNRVDFNNKFSHLRELYLPYKFELLLRGSQSRDGFTPKKFHELCDNKPGTVTFIKVKGTGEILGGYNPLIWKSSEYGEFYETKDSFIFSFKNGGNFFKDVIISNVKVANHAVYYHDKCGPYFGEDLIMWAYRSTDYNEISCRKCNYEKMIRDTRAIESKFSIEDYEVFQIK